MTDDEVIDLLTFAASYDRRTVGKADVAAWKLAVGDLSFADAMDSVVRHYRDSRDFIMPADIRVHVKAIRSERLAASLIPPPPLAVADNPAAYPAWLQARLREAGDGHGQPVPPAIGGLDLSERAGRTSSLASAIGGLRAKLGPARVRRAIESPQQAAARQAEAHRLAQDPGAGKEAS